MTRKKMTEKQINNGLYKYVVVLGLPTNNQTLSWQKRETIAESSSVNATNHKNSPDFTIFAASDGLLRPTLEKETWIARCFLFCIPETFTCQPHFLLDDEHNIIPILIRLWAWVAHCNRFPVQSRQVFLDKINNWLLVPDDYETSGPENTVHLNEEILCAAPFPLDVRNDSPSMEQIISPRIGWKCFAPVSIKMSSNFDQSNPVLELIKIGKVKIQFLIECQL